MTFLHEGGLRITVPAHATARRFDGDAHRLSHCYMKAVDFVIELPDCYRFIEVKNPTRGDDPEASAEEYLGTFTSGQVDLPLIQKYRDSLLYEWAAGRADKPVDYLVLIALDTIEDAQLLDRQEVLHRLLPVHLPSGVRWKRRFVRHCGVFNIASWNLTYPQYRVERVPEPPEPR